MGSDNWRTENVMLDKTDMMDHVKCRCGNQMFKIIPMFEKECILAVCPICYTRIYLAGPSSMYGDNMHD